MFALGTGSGVAAAAVVVAFVAGVGSCAPATTRIPGSPVGSTAVATRAPSPAAGITANVPIYYVGDTRNGLRLYREYHRVPAGDGSTAAKVKAALTQMFGRGAPYDVDYTSSWPAGTSVRSVKTSGGIATVDLHGVSASLPKSSGKAALQQLIWTATAYSGGTGVILRFDGAPRSTLWGSAVSGTLHRAAASATLAPVWVIDPQAQATTGTAVTVHLAGIVFEGTIQMRIRDTHGAVVVQKTVQLSVGAPAQGTATVHVTLKAGKYTIEAYEVSLKDSSIVALDGHPFTVK
jgi:hypothetical protein